MRGFRCHKALYLTIQFPELEPPIDAEKQALFDQGNEVGALARSYFKPGVLIDNKPWDFTGALARTREIIAKKTPVVFEAAFEHAGFYARADVLEFDPALERWCITEVKSSTKVKPEHIQDAALQAWIFAKNNFHIHRIQVMHLNSACRYPNLENLFTIVDVTDAVRERYKTIAPTLQSILNDLYKPTVPNIPIGSHCENPNPCEFMAHCWKHSRIPPMSILDLPGLRDKKWALFNEGIINLDDARLTDLNELQTRIIEAHRHNTRYHDINALRNAINTWEYPHYYLDFETINPAIPRYDNTGPYQQVPFQFSVHVQAASNSEVLHLAYLHDDASDPRPALIEALLQACGEQGAIIAYHSKFEEARIKELADYSEQHREALEALIPRLVDPLPLMREFIYDPAFHGKFGLKSVAPALLGESESYEGMLVANGGEAQRAFEKLISPKTPIKEKEALKQAMLDYCNKDTAIMLPLIRALIT